MIGDLQPCCDPSMNIFSAIFSNDCQYCTSSQVATNQTLMTNSNNAGNTSGIPCCDPSEGLLASIFSNTCNLCNPVGAAVGLPDIPSWAWILGLGTLGFVLLKKDL